MPFDPKDPDTIAALEAAVTEATNKLDAKNKQLLDELKKARKNAEIDPEDYAKLQRELDETQTKLSDADKVRKAAEKAAADATKALQGESAFTQRLLIDNGLNAALLEAGVKNPVHLKAVTAMMRGQVEIKVEGDARKAVVGDKDLTAYIKEWSASDEGKQFVAAPSNTGGGASGSQGGGGAKTMTRTAFDALDPAAKMEFSKGGGQLTE